MTAAFQKTAGGFRLQRALRLLGGSHPSAERRRSGFARSARWVLAIVGLLLLSGCPARTPTEVLSPPASGNPAPVPSIDLPTGPPGGTSLPSVLPPYRGRADDLQGFTQAFRAALGDARLGEADAVGRELCTYLVHHADDSGVVAVDQAVNEAEIHQPGYARETWLRAFQLASEHYCPEFDLASEESEG